jgi:hypothetical protein
MKTKLYNKKGVLIGAEEIEIEFGDIKMKKVYNLNDNLVLHWRLAENGKEYKTTYIYDKDNKLIKTKLHKSPDEKTELFLKILRYFCFSIFLITPNLILYLKGVYSASFSSMLAIINIVISIAFITFLTGLVDFLHSLFYYGSSDWFMNNEEKSYTTESFFKYLIIFTLINLYTVFYNNNLFILLNR